MYDHIVETIERDGLTANIRYDELTESPLEYADPITLFVTWNNSTLGHEEMPSDSVAPILSHFNIDYVCSECGEEIWDDYEDGDWCHSDETQQCGGKKIEPNTDELTFMPLYVYEHSGITMNTGGYSCQWDSGMAGYAVVDHRDLNWDAEPEKLIKDFIRIYAEYLEGQVYWYEILDETGETVDSCGGFIGSDNVEKEVNEMLDFYSEREQKITLKKQAIASLIAQGEEFLDRAEVLKSELIELQKENA